MKKILLLLVLTACSVMETPTVGPDDVPGGDRARMDALAVSTLNRLQPLSIAARVEYCAYILQGNQGLYLSQIWRGNTDYCELGRIPLIIRIVASLHTHAEFNPLYDSEIPSEQDVKADFADGTFGYVSTPSGRVWVIDPITKRIELLCGVRCVRADANYDPRLSRPIKTNYTLAEIER